MEILNNEDSFLHNVTLQNRKHLVVTGVIDVERFDENSIVMYTELGKLSVKGKDLNISRLDIGYPNGEVVIDGEVDVFEYNKGKSLRKKESLFAKLLG